MEIRSISSTQTFEIRHPILRAGQPLESCKFIGDEDEETLHFGAYEEGASYWSSFVLCKQWNAF